MSSLSALSALSAAPVAAGPRARRVLHGLQRASLAVLLLAAATLVVSSSARAATTFEQGVKRETALLVAERDALQREQERIEVEHAAKAAALRATLATLEARVVEASAREETLRAAVQAHAALATSSTMSSSSSSSQEALRATFATLGGPTPVVTPGADAAVQLLPVAVQRLRERAAPHTIESGFFDVDGAFVKGQVTRWGPAAWAAASDAAGPAGALLPAVDGARQLAAADAAAATNARAFVAGQTPALLPLVLGTASEDDAPGPVVVAGFAERLGRLGKDGAGLLVVLALCLVVAAGALARVVRAHRAVAAVAGRLPALVAAGELAAAAALARTVPGSAGSFLQAVVSAVTRARPDDEVAALSTEAGFALQRAHHVARVGAVVSAAAVLFVAARAWSGAVLALLGAGDVPVRAVLDALAGALLPVELGALVAIPWAALLIGSSVLVARARERLEVLALRMLDAVGRELA